MIKLEKLRKSTNIAELLDEDELAKISQQVISGYEIDKESRAEWEDVIDNAMEIAKQTLEVKNFPWPKASNVKFPLITKGSIDFSSRMLPEIIKNDKVFKTSTVGLDPHGVIARRAKRVQDFMDYQLLKKSDDWEENTDRMLSVLSILGTTFKKVFYDPIEQRPVSQLCLPTKIVVNYNTESLEKARRVTHELTFFTNDIIERIRSGIYLDIDVDKLRMGDGVSEDVYDPPLDLLEQHCYLDLDDDGYKEPYIVVLHKASRQVLRIVNRFDKTVKNKKGEVKRITAKKYFVDYHFLKSPDGGFYSLGYGALLYPLNKSINSIYNQLIDSGTLHNQQSGFIGRGLRIKGGEFRMKLGEWKVLDASSGTNINQNVVPLPTKEPSNVSLQLLNQLIEVGRDLTSTNEALEGKAPAQNVAATTMLTLVEQGMKVYNAITKRIFRSLKKELNLLFEINSKHLTDEEYRNVLNDPRVTVEDDFEVGSFDVIPVADPNMASDAQRNAKAQALMSIPGLNPYETSRYFLESLQLDQNLIDKLLPKPDPNAPPPPEVMKLQAEVEKLKAQAQKDMAEAQDLQNKNQVEMEKLRIAQEESIVRNRESAARIVKMEKDAIHGDMKMELAGGKADHEAKLKELDMLQQRELNEADLSLKSMDKITKAYEVSEKAKKEAKDVGNRSK